MEESRKKAFDIVLNKQEKEAIAKKLHDTK